MLSDSLTKPHGAGTFQYSHFTGEAQKDEAQRLFLSTWVFQKRKDKCTSVQINEPPITIKIPPAVTDPQVRKQANVVLGSWTSVSRLTAGLALFSATQRWDLASVEILSVRGSAYMKHQMQPRLNQLCSASAVFYNAVFGAVAVGRLRFNSATSPCWLFWPVLSAWCNAPT